MTLRILQPGAQPLGQFDGLDAEVTAGNGGEVCTFTTVAVTGTDLAAKDADGSDGYVGIPPLHFRPAVTTTLASGNRPLFLCDDGSAGTLDTRGYGTLFGRVVGGTVGQISTGGAVLGPHTATGSGKLTLWDKPGLYAVTLDAADTTATTGLVTNNPTIATGDALFATTAGLITPNSGNTFEAVAIGRFIEFNTEGSLVTTPNTQVSALNSPSGDGTPALTLFTNAVFTFNPELS